MGNSKFVKKGKKVTMAFHSLRTIKQSMNSPIRITENKTFLLL